LAALASSLERERERRREEEDENNVQSTTARERGGRELAAMASSLERERERRREEEDENNVQSTTAIIAITTTMILMIKSVELGYREDMVLLLVCILK